MNCYLVWQLKVSIFSDFIVTDGVLSAINFPLMELLGTCSTKVSCKLQELCCV